MNSGVLCEEYCLRCGNVVGNNAFFFSIGLCENGYVVIERRRCVYIMIKRIVGVKMWSLSVVIECFTNLSLLCRLSVNSHLFD